MTDNIFEIETTALAHVACAPQESGVLLTDFAAAYPSQRLREYASYYIQPAVAYDEALPPETQRSLFEV